jgi:hypothetical protein
LAELTLDAEKSTIFVFKKRKQICRWKKKTIFVFFILSLDMRRLPYL